MKNVVILGAGISGLTLACALKEKARVTLIEKTDRVGGWIRTIEQDGFLFELGPRSCRPKGAGLATLELIEKLGLQDEVIPGEATSRYLYIDQKLQKVPESLISSLFSPLTRGIFPSLIKEYFTPKSVKEDESIYSFFSRRFGGTIAERFVDPLALGIYAGDIHQLSMKSCFPSIYIWEKEYGSVMKGMLSQRRKPLNSSPFIQEMQKYSLFSFKKGMETLPKALAVNLKSELMLNTTVTALKFYDDCIAVQLSSGEQIRADHVYSTLPAQSLSDLWPNPVSQQHQVNSIHVVSLGYKKNVLKQKGFGYLIPSNQNESLLGVVFDSCIFPQQNLTHDETRLTVMVKPGLEDQKNVLDSLNKHLKISDLPDTYHCSFSENAIPQYYIGHQQRLDALELPKNFSVLGSSFYGVAVNDCISKAIKTAQHFS